MDNNSNKQQVSRPLEKINYILMGVAVFMIVLGYFLISGEPTTEEKFNPDIFSATRIVVGPTISFLGFVFMFFAILYKKKSK